MQVDSYEKLWNFAHETHELNENVQKYFFYF